MAEIQPVYLGDDGKRHGMSQAARDLGVSRNHLICVLRKERTSKKLMAEIERIHPELLSPELSY